MKHSELLFKCETAALLLREAKDKVSGAQRDLRRASEMDLPSRKPPNAVTAKIFVMPKHFGAA